MQLRVGNQRGEITSRDQAKMNSDDIDALLVPATCTSVEIKSPAFSNDTFSKLCARLPQLQLQQLTLNNFFISAAEWVELFTSLQKCKTLRALDLSTNHVEAPDNKLPEVITSLTHLKSLKLYNVPLTETAKTALFQAVLKHPSLENVAGIVLTEEVKTQLAFNKKYHCIEAILQECEKADQDNKLSLPLLRLKQQELFSLLEEKSLTACPQRRNEILAKVYYHLGCWFNQKEETSQARRYLERVLHSPHPSPLKESARQELAALYFTQADDPTLDPLEKIALLEKVVALNDPALFDYANRTLLSTYDSALASLEKTGLKISQNKVNVEKKLAATSPSFQETASRFKPTTTRN